MRAPQAVLALVAVTAIAIAVGESTAHGRDRASARALGRPNIIVLMTDDETVRYASVRRTLHRVLERLAHCRGASCRKWAPRAAEAAP